MAVPTPDDLKDFNEKEFEKAFPKFVISKRAESLKTQAGDEYVGIMPENWLREATEYYESLIKNETLKKLWLQRIKAILTKKISSEGYNFSTEVYDWDIKAYGLLREYAQAEDLARKGSLYESLKLLGFKEDEDYLNPDNVAALKAWGLILNSVVSDPRYLQEMNKEEAKKIISDFNEALNDVGLTGQGYSIKNHARIWIYEMLKKAVDLFANFFINRAKKKQDLVDDLMHPSSDAGKLYKHGKELQRFSERIKTKIDNLKSHKQEKELIGRVVKRNKTDAVEGSKEHEFKSDRGRLSMH